MDNVFERLLYVFHANKNKDFLDVVWDTVMKKSMSVELNRQNLDNMSETDLVEGFGFGDGIGQLVLLAEATGVSGITNPENNAFHNTRIPSRRNVDGLGADDILDQIQNVLPFDIRFPEFHGGSKRSTKTKFGMFGDRHIHYLWLVKKVLELCPERSSRIIEVGAGFGVLGYYLSKAGYYDYTTIDLSLINAIQTYYLHQNLPDRDIIMSGEVKDPFDMKFREAIKLLHCTDFDSVPSGRFDLMVNMDGLTEYGVEQATKYVQSDCAKMLLSINHEVHPYRICEIPQPKRKMAYRYLFWTRPGYVEELYVPKD